MKRREFTICFVVQEDGVIWIDGVRKRSPDKELVKVMEGRHRAYVKLRTENGRVKYEHYPVAAE
jgi:hypothetical protein